MIKILLSKEKEKITESQNDIPAQNKFETKHHIMQLQALTPLHLTSYSDHHLYLLWYSFFLHYSVTKIFLK